MWKKKPWPRDDTPGYTHHVQFLPDLQCVCEDQTILLDLIALVFCLGCAGWMWCVCVCVGGGVHAEFIWLFFLLSSVIFWNPKMYFYNIYFCFTPVSSLHSKIICISDLKGLSAIRKISIICFFEKKMIYYIIFFSKNHLILTEKRLLKGFHSVGTGRWFSL